MPEDHIQSYEELHRKYILELKNGDGIYCLPKDKILANFKEWIKHQAGNDAYVLLDIPHGKYIEWYGISEKFGYTNEQFTAGAITNLAEPKLIYPEHIVHKKRYSDILIKLLSSDIKFNVRTDSYSVEFKIKHEKGHFLPVRRTSIIFQIASEKELLTRLDRYEILSKHHADYVYPEIKMGEQGKSDELNEMFYKKNLEYLGLKRLFASKNEIFSPKHVQIFYKKLQSSNLTNKQIGFELGLSEEKVERIFFEISRKLRDNYQQDTETMQGVQVIKALARTYGLFPIPKRLIGSTD